MRPCETLQVRDGQQASDAGVTLSAAEQRPQIGGGHLHELARDHAAVHRQNRRSSACLQRLG